MIKYIKVKNFLSFKKETEINFQSDFKSKKDNVFEVWKNERLMKNMLIYWANASWKSNILKVVQIINLVALIDNFPSNLITPFLLDLNSEKNISFFEIAYFVDNREFKYNFEIFEWKILTENLFEISIINKETREEVVFKRKWLKVISWEWFEKELKKWEGKIKENSSVISVLSRWNWKLAWKNIDYFFKKINIFWNNHNYSESLTIDLLKIEKNKKSKEFLLNFLRFADINIEDIKIEKKPIPDFILERIKKDINSLDFEDNDFNKIKKNWIVEVFFWHKKEWSNELRYFNLESESDWTRKLFSILWPIVDTILNERVLFVDEIENNLHLHILQELLKFINSDIQWKKYQFIFTTHNLSLMDLKVLKKEQIWIVEKNNLWNSDFYTLYDFEKFRSESDIKKYYNAWILWWIPTLWDFKSLLDNFKLWDDEER